MALLETFSLVKDFGRLRAVDGVSLAIREGMCFGLLGPNGAGKTTTVEMMEGVKPPTSGTIRYRGEGISRRFREECGILFQSTALPDFLRVSDLLDLFGALYPRTTPRAALVEACALGEFLGRDVKKLSGGQRQRVLLAIALVNDPTVVFLDEPTTGLDPQARHNFWELVRGIKARGTTTVLTTHYMEEAYQLCDEIAIMDHGRVIAAGTPDSLLRAQFEGSVVELPRADFAPSADFAWRTHERDGMVEIQTADPEATLRDLMARGVSLHHLKIKSRTLEDLFLELTGRELRA